MKPRTRPNFAALRARLRAGLRRLSRGEQFALHRRARQLTQQEISHLYGVSPDVVGAWERNEGAVPAVPNMRLSELTLRELCWLRMRRQGVTIVEMASATGRSISGVHGALSGRRGVEEVVDYLCTEVDA